METASCCLAVFCISFKKQLWKINVNESSIVYRGKILMFIKSKTVLY
jgi:hypothetical protein